MISPDVPAGMKPLKEYFVGIDSDGCVFDTMEVKQKEFFIPNGIKFFNLFAISKVVRETWEFVSLYSVHRGANRFPALINIFDLLRDRTEILDAGITIPSLNSLREWVSTETKLGNQQLRQYYLKNADPGLKVVLDWTEAINNEIGTWLKGVSPFRYARESIELIHNFADSIVISQTPFEALEREWKEHRIDKLVRVIAGQEYGTKAEMIAMATRGKYSDDRILIIGDASGDLLAAQANGVLFYPVVPGRESDSWKRFKTEAFGRFLEGSYSGNYQDSLLKEFKRALPAKPPWGVW